METKTIYQKLLSVQSEIGVVAKGQENPFYKSKYADINAYLDVVKPVLTKNGLILMQPIHYINGKNVLHTEIRDSESDLYITSDIALPDNSDPQKYGAIITYFRRFGLVSLLSLQAEDTDGNDTAEKTVTYNKPRTTDGNKEIPSCSICGNPMKPTKPGSKTPFYCKHGNSWGKPVFKTDEITPKEQEFLDNLGVEVE